MNKSLKNINVIIIIIMISMLNFACAGFGRRLKSFLGGSTSTDALTKEEAELALGQTRNENVGPYLPRFSDTEYLPYASHRKYKRINRDRLEEDAELDQKAGSLWVNEGQGAFLFTQNTSRMLGDLLKVKIDGGPRSQLEAKARVIQRLLDKLENTELNDAGLSANRRRNGPAVGGTPAGSVGNPNATANGELNGAVASGSGANTSSGAASSATDANIGSANTSGVGAAPGNNVSGGDVGRSPAAVAGSPAAARAANDPLAGVDSVPTKIVEVLKDGSYRIKGSQSFMIGSREYRAIVTGVVRPEDFSESGLSADHLIDAHFDIVSDKKGANL